VIAFIRPALGQDVRSAQSCEENARHFLHPENLSRIFLTWLSLTSKGISKRTETIQIQNFFILKATSNFGGM
jgi:hypothetical protein